ncbi:phosphohexomutase domain-containing protein [Pseudomonas donghuensis]|uniref:phosphomannomutase n=1 Tax=Pseudomonas donghuensis TaxID=1163398 RepID=UPI000C2AECD6|nr:phosphomannomutase [Pseudomonas donghuensis]PJY97753.1 phosphomannomutase [Pseudomonas donghuensis]WKY27021.1 phosphomannomutase [Pseudomonas donghuensis]
MTTLSCFKAYDIRGKVPEQLNDEIAYDIGRALVAELNGRCYVVGRDMRLESPSIANALIKGITESGADVIDIGLCGTEEVYFATSHYQASGGVMVTASHNPKGYNGMKLVREESRPISGDSGLLAIKARVQEGRFGVVPSAQGRVSLCPDKNAYLRHLLGYVNTAELKPLKILANPGNGAAGPVIEALEAALPFEWVVINAQPDGHFPQGVPNPLLPENRSQTREALLAHGCDMALAWDGDFDRCFFFDSNGRFIEGYYLVALLAETLLKRNPGARIIHDPRLTWNTIDTVRSAGGVAIQSKTGHAFIKERMRSDDAVYGGEMSAHHYFREFFYCDSGMIPWLLVCAVISESGKSLAELVDEYIAQFPCSGEINYQVDDVSATILRIRKHFSPQALQMDETDGVSLEFENWRFNVRGSNTEPLLRLNIETRADERLLQRKIVELEQLIQEC